MINKSEKKHYETIIIGAGVIGSSIAYHLSEKKQKEILVIEKGFPLSGTSGATQAWVWVHSKTPNYYGELSLRSADLYTKLEKKIGNIDYIRSGGLAPFFHEEDFEKAIRLKEHQAKVGIEIEVLTKEEVLDKEPYFSPKVVGATFCKLDGNVNPFKLLKGYIQASKKNGVEFSFYNSVETINQTSSCYVVTTSKGTFTSKQLVLAGGPWSKELGELIGIQIPIKQVRGQILVTEPLAPILRHTIGGMRQLDNGIVLVGYSKEEVGFDRRGTLDVLQETAKMAIDFVPNLSKANIVRAFSGIRVIPEDDLPIFGEIPDRKNLFVATMHSGMTLSPIIGEQLSELIVNGDCTYPMERYSISRFQD
jgi:sarcosine oxidase subunit beta